eukprot:SAG22_NODE_2782_length_2214_cov_1.717730_1_plen_177_part_10
MSDARSPPFFPGVSDRIFVASADKDAAEGWGGLKPLGGLSITSPSFGGLPFAATQRIANGTVTTSHGNAFSTESFIHPNENILATTITVDRAVNNLSIELWTMGGQCTGPFVNASTCRSLRPTDACAYPTGAAVDAPHAAAFMLSLWRETGFAFQRTRSQNITRMGVLTRVLPVNSS